MLGKYPWMTGYYVTLSGVSLLLVAVGSWLLFDTWGGWLMFWGVALYVDHVVAETESIVTWAVEKLSK